MTSFLKLVLALSLTLNLSSALSQAAVWDIPVRSNRVGLVATIVAPGVAWPAGTPLGGYAAQAPVAVVGSFYAALAAGNVSAAAALVCPADRAAFAANADELISRAQEFRTQERVGLIQQPSRALVFVRLNSQSGVQLRMSEVLPPSGASGSCITQQDPTASLVRDLLAASMSELTVPDFPNPYPNGVPAQLPVSGVLNPALSQ
jgi:hypothetical protein